MLEDKLRNKPMDNKLPDFIAILNYKLAEEGGRKTPAHTGYRPAIKFNFSDKQTTGQQTFINRDLVYPGESVKAAIKIASPNLFEKSLAEGMVFEFKEGQVIIGTGQIIEIINNAK